MSHNYPVESDPTAARCSNAQDFATTAQSQETIGEAMAWSPCYVCFDSAGLRSYSSIIVVRLLMHEIWMWENEMADEDQAKAESVPLETELLPCHYFDFFYGVSRGGLVATLLGRLRLRVDDAADEYRDITQAVFRDRRLFSSALPLEHMKLLNYRRKDLRKAVHNTVTKHLIDRTECGGADQLFRPPASTRWPAEPDAPKQAQTCVKVYGGRFEYKVAHTLCTFKYGPDQKECLHDAVSHSRAFTDQLDWTICHVLVAAMATPGFFLRSRETSRTGTTAMIWMDASVAMSNPTGDAALDYKFLCRRGALPAPNLELPANTKQSTSENHPLFLSIGYRREPKEKGNGKSKLMSTSLYNAELNHSAERTHDTVSSVVVARGDIYARLYAQTQLDARVMFGAAINALKFETMRKSTVEFINNDEESKRKLRQIAQELVRRRRARQAMGGPRWEVFAGNTAKTGDGDEVGRS